MDGENELIVQDEFNLDEYDLEEEEPQISKENALKALKPFLKRCGVNPKKIRDEEKKERIVNCIDVVRDAIMTGILEIEEIEGEYQGTEFSFGYSYIYTGILVIVLKGVSIFRHLVKPPEETSKYKEAALQKLKLRK